MPLPPSSTTTVSTTATAQSEGRANTPPERREGRRRFFASAFDLGFGWGLALLAATGLAWLLGGVRFLFPGALPRRPRRFAAGRPEQYPFGVVDDRFKEEHGLWVVHHSWDGEPQIFALHAECTHLGCTPLWIEAEQRFKCPCHGSGFRKDGTNIDGPAPRPLERFAIELGPDGQLNIDRSQVFREDRGEWDDPRSYVSPA